jgi:Fe-S-cluster containining protein
MDTRVSGKLTARLAKIARKHVPASDLLDVNAVPLRTRVLTRVPDCARCNDRCCVHREPGSGILLSLQDVAHLVDSGLGHLIVGKFTFRRDRRGRFVGDIDEMPRLKKKKSGLCHYYDEKSGKCMGYGVRPTICRRFPYEIAYKRGTMKPFAQFIPWASCPTVKVPVSHPSALQMARDAAADENVTYEDTVLLPERVEELRRAGFGPYLPPPEECPPGPQARGNGRASRVSGRAARARKGTA